MSEIKFYELKCKRCGGQLTELSSSLYRCVCCGKVFEKQTVTDVADQIRAVLNEQKQEAVANLKQQLWTEMHARYINSSKITSLSRDIKKYLPDDYFANFCEVANAADNRAVNDFLNQTSTADMRDYADIVLDFMLKSAKPANLTAISLFIERAFKGDPKNYDKYTTALETEAENINKGVYDLIIPRDVFLAYSSADIDKVLELCDYLESNKITCFLALRNLRHGKGAVDNYDQALKIAIDNCKTVVFVSSTNSRDLDCDAVTKELPYIRQKDISAAPAEYRHDYTKLPAEYMMPRVEYLIEDYTGGVAEMITKEFFHGLEWCKNKEAVAQRVTRYLIQVVEAPIKKAESASQAQTVAYGVKTEKVIDSEQPIKANFTSGKKYCTHCKAFSDGKIKFCANCGGNKFIYNYDEYIASKLKFCSNCGTQNNVEDKFCVECGFTEFVPTKKDYEELAAKREQERRRVEEEKNRENEERKRLGEAAYNFIKNSQINKKGALIVYNGNQSDVVIPDCITSIGKYVFASNKTLKNVTIPSSVKAIEESAFSDCERLSSVVINEGVTSIGKYAFSGCNSLKIIAIPETVKKIDTSAFINCNSLNSIIIPSSVTFMCEVVFWECKNLKTIYCRAKKPLFGLPAGWQKSWLGNCQAKVVWNYKG